MSNSNSRKGESLPYFCGACGEPCNAEFVDFGIGPYECHGHTGVDTRIEWVSDCCESDVYEDEERHCPAEPPSPDDREYDPDEDEDWGRHDED